MSDSHFDWQRRFTGDTSAPAVVDSRRRMRLLLAGFVLLLATVMARAIALEVNHGEAFRRHAAEPLRRQVVLPASRGRILARDDTVLAEDQGVTELTVAYRVLQTPVNPAWIRRQARRRLSRQDRSDATRVAEAQAAMVAKLKAELAALHRRLAQITGTTADAWTARRRRIKYRVERIADSVNARHQGQTPPEADDARTTNNSSPDTSWLARAGRWFNQTFPPPPSLAGQRCVVAEQAEHQALATEL
jgi:cell division protein FtsI/penicillin-binding protein 2